MQTTGRHLPGRGGHGGNNNSTSVALADHLNNGATMVSLFMGGQTIICDEVSDDLTYVGWAAPGSKTAEGMAAAIWKIAMMTPEGITWAYVVETDPKTEKDMIFAARPEHIWDDRAELNYA